VSRPRLAQAVMEASRNVTAEPLSWELVSGRDDPAQRFRIYCRDHAGELTLIATCGTPEAVGVAIITLGREHEFEDCALGILDVLGEKGQRWILRPWEASAKNISDAGRTLRTARKP